MPLDGAFTHGSLVHGAGGWCFTRLVEVLTQDGMPKTTATRLKYVSLVATVCWGEGVQELCPFSVWQHR